MRISDWSSDVCSSDLPPLRGSATEIIESQLLHARADARPQYRWHRARMQRWRDWLHVGVEQPPLPSDWQVHWDTRAPLPLPAGGSLQLDTPYHNALMVRARRGGARLRQTGRASWREKVRQSV